MQHITAETLQKRLAGGEDIILLDVREKWEHEAFNIGGQLTPLSALMEHAGTIPRQATVVVYCQKGIRSQIAIQRLQGKLGLDNLINLQGGIEAWQKQSGAFRGRP